MRNVKQKPQHGEIWRRRLGTTVNVFSRRSRMRSPSVQELAWVAKIEAGYVFYRRDRLDLAPTHRLMLAEFLRSFDRVSLDSPTDGEPSPAESSVCSAQGRRRPGLRFALNQRLPEIGRLHSKRVSH